MFPWGYWEFVLVERELERQKLEKQQRLIHGLVSSKKSSGLLGFIRNWLLTIQTRRNKEDSLRIEQGKQTTSAASKVMHTLHCARHGEYVSSNRLQG